MGKVASRFRRRKKRQKPSDVQLGDSMPDLTSTERYQTGKGTRRPDRFTYSETDLRSLVQHVDRPKTYPFNEGDDSLYSRNLSPITIEKNAVNFSIKDTSNEKLLVVAIDIGSSYSGYAYCTRKDFCKDRSKIHSPTWPCENGQYYKNATAVLFKSDGSFYKFGFDAEKYYKNSDDDLKNWYFFRNFKMVLYERKMSINKDLTLTDIHGKEMKALKVFSTCIHFLKDHFLLSLNSGEKDNFSNKDIHWVITVPAIWDMRAKQFMKDAAEEAGITDEQLSLALEPEAASLYCRQVPISTNVLGRINTVAELEAGSSYMVLDQGGGTIDITVHEILPDNSLKEVFQANGGDWGGNSVNRKFEQFLENVFTQQVINEVKVNKPSEYANILQDFERKKRGFPPNLSSDSEDNRSDIKFPIGPVFQKTYDDMHKSTIPVTLPVKYGKLSISQSDYEQFFQESISNIIAHISSLLEHHFLKDVKVILAVGGYSESSILMNKLRETFPDIRIVIPKNPGVAVLKGAVLFGFEPYAVKTRISRFTYGIKVERQITADETNDFRKIRKDQASGEKFATEVFEKLVTIGDHIEVGVLQPPKEYEPLSRHQQKASIEFYATEEEDPNEVSDDGCIELGTLEVDLSEREDYNGCLRLQINAGGTEISAVVTEDQTGNKFQAHFCLP